MSDPSRTCSICEIATFDGDRVQAAEAGWIFTLARDVCPKCVKRMKSKAGP